MCSSLYWLSFVAMVIVSVQYVLNADSAANRSADHHHMNQREVIISVCVCVSQQRLCVLSDSVCGYVQN